MTDIIHLTNDTLLQGGKYRIVRYISSGGFGCTYEAIHVMLGKKVAIKEFFVKDFCNRDEETFRVTLGTQSKRGLVDRLKGKFIDEAQALSRMRHSGIVAVSDVFEENGTAYYVMDYVEGDSLGEIVRNRGALVESEALGYIRQVCDALAYVHSHNRLHLDIKPGNIMISKSGHVVLIDFGASKQYDEVDGENTSTLLGKTPGYAPIEQIGNDVVRFFPATDIYALGATLYKALTGKTPPPSNIIAGGELPDPLPANVSRSTVNAIEQAMRLDKRKRPQSVEEFCELLDRQLPVEDELTEISVIDVKNPDEGDSKEPEQEHGGKKKWYLATAGAVAVAVIAWFAFAPDAPSDPGTHVKNKKIISPDSIIYLFTGILHADSIPNGEGTGWYDEGTYVGSYVNGRRHGEAEYTTSDGENVFKGTYRDDKYERGKLTFRNGSYYEGTFKNNTYDNGLWHDKDGTVSEIVNGEFK